MLLRNSYLVSIIRTILLGPYFVLGCINIVFTHQVARVIFKNSPQHFQAVVNLTKDHFIHILTFLCSVITPQQLHILYDKQETDFNFSIDANGILHGSLLPNLVLILNHQIYTDWLNLWYLLSRSRFGNCVHIFLKDMLWIPILGSGMKTYNFFFLSRKWEKDKVLITNQLLEIDANARGYGPANGVKQVSLVNVTGSKYVKWPSGNIPTISTSESKITPQVWPFEIILFPEGTVPSPRARERSRKYCEDKGIKPLENVLLPRVRGLFLTLRKLRKTVEYVYDISVGYSGLKKGENGEDIFTLKRFFLFGDGPKNVHFHIQKWKIADIPLGSDLLGTEIEDIDDVDPETLQKFEDWLFDMWREKDDKLEFFFKEGSFEFNDSIKTVSSKLINASYFDAVTPFLPIISVLLLLRILWMGLTKFLF